MAKSQDFALLNYAYNRPKQVVTIEQLKLFVKGGRITADEFKEITGEDYVA